MATADVVALKRIAAEQGSAPRAFGSREPEEGLEIEEIIHAMGACHGDSLYIERQTT